MKKERFRVFGTLRFIFIAVVLMLLADQFIFGGKRSYIENAKTVQIERPPPVRVLPEDGKEFFEAPVVPPAPPPVAATVPMAEPDNIVKAPDTPAPAPSVLKEDGVHPHPRIAIIIDDMGMDVKRSRQVIDLDAPVTLAFLPYAPRTRELAKLGKEKGHSLIIHTPMQAVDASVNIGPGGLKAGMDDAAFTAAFDVMLNSFEGYEGINNHMGSRLTQDKEAMDRLMDILAAKKLFFVDSKTIQSSLAAKEASQSGVPFAERDVFLDHVDSAAFVKDALARTEKVAMRRGSAIAIGHPKDFTIAGLKAWIPTLEAKGIELVPVKDLLRSPEEVEIPQEPPAIVPQSLPEKAPEEISPAQMPEVVIDPAVPEIQLHPLPEQLPEPLLQTP